MVDVVELMAAVLEDSPSNRLTMLQTSGVCRLVLAAVKSMMLMQVTPWLLQGPCQWLAVTVM